MKIKFTPFFACKKQYSLILPLFFLFALISNLNLHAQKFAWANNTIVNASNYYNGITSVISDQAGNLYQAFNFLGTSDFDPGTGVSQLTSAGSTDVAIAKYSTNGNLIWAKSFGGTSQDFVSDLTVDANGNIYIAGSFQGTVDFDPGPGTAMHTADASGDPFVCKFNSAGDFVWVYTIANIQATNGEDIARKVAVDDDGNVYTSGYFRSNIDVDAGAGNATLTYAGPAQSVEAFLIKLDPDGNYINGLAIDPLPGNSSEPTAMTLRNGKVYAVINAANKNHVYHYDLDLNPGLIIIPATYLFINSIDVDDAGNLLVNGYYNGTLDADPGPGVYTITTPIAYNQEMYVAKWNATGNLIWIKTIVSADVVFNGNFSQKSVFDRQTGDVYFIGVTADSSYFDGVNMSNFIPVIGRQNAFIEKLDQSGNILSLYLLSNGNANIWFQGIAIDNVGNIYTNGTFDGIVDFNPDSLVSNTMSAPAQFQGKYLLKLGTSNHIRGAVFMDANGDGIRQPAETGFPDVLIVAQQGATIAGDVSRLNGLYDIPVNAGTYAISPSQAPPYYILSTTPQSATFAGSSGGIDNSNDIGMKPIATINDLSVNLQYLSIPRPGRDFYIDIHYNNTGTTTLTGSVAFHHSPELVFQNASVLPSNNTGPDITWNFSNLAPLSHKMIRVHFTVSAAAIPGTTITQLVNILPVAADTTPVNNTSSLSNIIFGSFDPNDKSVLPSGPVSTDFIAADSTYLEYTIRFQNTGNDTAYSVIVRDTLENTLDISSFKMIAASHPYTIKLEPGNVLVFTFDPAKLPDSTTNEPLSHGYVVFRIKPFTNLLPGAAIHNTAAIYFDFNVPVMTNQTENIVSVVVPVKLNSFTVKKQTASVLINWTTEQEINSQSFIIERSTDQNKWDAIASVNAAGNSAEKINYNTTDFNPAKGINYYRLKQVDVDGRFTYSEIRSVYFGTDANVVIAPNPAKDKITIYMPGNESFVSISIYDMNARLIKTINTREESVQVDLRGIAKGIYMAKINGRNVSVVEKLLIR